MKQITEYLLSKNKQCRIRPSDDSSIDEIAEWIRSYGVQEHEIGYIPAKNDIGYCINKSDDTPAHYWIALRNNPDQIQNIVIMPKAKSFITLGKMSVQDYYKHISIEQALDLMHQILENPKTKLYKAKL